MLHTNFNVGNNIRLYKKNILIIFVRNHYVMMFNNAKKVYPIATKISLNPIRLLAPFTLRKRSMSKCLNVIEIWLIYIFILLSWMRVSFFPCIFNVGFF